MEVKTLQVEDVQKAPELLVSQVIRKEKVQKKEMNKSKVVGWSTDQLEQKASRNPRTRKK